VRESQVATVERFNALRDSTAVYVMPVLQGQTPQDYVNHLAMYGGALPVGAWVGVGSIAKSLPSEIEAILMAISAHRPDLKLHGFGVKKRALDSAIVWDLLHSADSQATFAPGRGVDRFIGRNNPESAIRYANSIKQPDQLSIFAC
jgi:hypothetical protein